MKLGRSIVALLFTGVVLAACQTASPTATDSASPTGSASPSGGVVTASPTPPAASPSGSSSAKPPTGSEVTLTGVVSFVGVEGGCWGLKVGGKTYELMGGDRSVLTDGARVEVRGIVRSDMATICQIGTPLEVLSARAV